ncbi:hypothetical protein BDV12DRAFT_203531 [Aspergillus spectabilis]
MATATGKRPVVIAGCSGGTVDRPRALFSLSQLPEIDAIVGDWMSEADMTHNGAKRAAFKAQLGGVKGLGATRDGFHANFLDKVKPALKHLAANKTKVVCNAGGSNAHGLAEAVKELIAGEKLALRVGWIEGDDVTEAMQKLIDADEPLTNLTTGKAFASWGREMISAQCYLGATGIARALEECDIVICGRVADSSPCIGVAMWWHGWTRQDLGQLAAALVAGHLIECSSYVTGGYYSGFKKWKGDAVDLAFPLAHIDSLGGVELSLEPGRDGEISIGTVTSQLVYEIQGPLYFNSDVVAQIDQIRVEQLAPDRVRVSGVRGHPPPPTTKAGITAQGGYSAEYHIYLTGLDIPAKIEMVRRQTLHAMGERAKEFQLLQFTQIGVPQEDPVSQDLATVSLRIFAQSASAELLGPAGFLQWCKQNILQSCPGLTPTTDPRQGLARPYFEYWVTLIEQRLVQESVHLPDGQVVAIPPPQNTRVYPAQQDSYEPRSPLPADSWGPVAKAPLGLVCLGRSGDKSSDANLGLFVRHSDEWDWLRSTLSTERLRRLLGDDETGKAILRFELPHLRAVHFLLKDHLDRGYNAGAGLDCLGKNLAEYVRAKVVEIPVRFLERGAI